MGKIINAYNGYTAQQIKERADIPNQSDMIVNGSTVDCSNISISKIKNVLGEGSTSVGSLCTSNKVNIWSNFSPIEWYSTGGNLLNRIKTPYTMGSFAGYNHNAQPINLNSKIINVYYTFNTTSLSFYADISMGEINWDSIGCNYIKLVIKDGGTIIGSSITLINTTDMYVEVDVPINGWSFNKTLTGYLYLSNSGGDVYGLVPNTSEWVINGIYQSSTGSSRIDGATGTFNITSGGQYWISFEVGGTPDVVAVIYDTNNNEVYRETLATSTNTRYFSGTFNPYNSSYYVVFYIWDSV